MSISYRICLDSKPGAFYNKVLPEVLTLCSLDAIYERGKWKNRKLDFSLMRVFSVYSADN